MLEMDVISTVLDLSTTRPNSIDCNPTICQVAFQVPLNLPWHSNTGPGSEKPVLTMSVGGLNAPAATVRVLFRFGVETIQTRHHGRDTKLQGQPEGPPGMGYSHRHPPGPSQRHCPECLSVRST